MKESMNTYCTTLMNKMNVSDNFRLLSIYGNDYVNTRVEYKNGDYLATCRMQLTYKNINDDIEIVEDAIKSIENAYALTIEAKCRNIPK